MNRERLTKQKTHNTLTSTDLEQEIVRLKKINVALISRVEREAASKTESAYSLFETAATLEVAVEQRTTELLHVNNLLRKEIDRRENIEKQLKHAKDDAEKANKNKTQFLVAVSHDLNQPLTAAHLMAGSLLEELELSTPNIDSLLLYAKRVSTSLETMENLLNSLVDISKLEAGVVETNITDFSIALILKQLDAEYSLQAQQRRLTFRYVLSTMIIRSDLVLLGRVLRNIISNAMRYTTKGKILLGCRRKKNALSIEVWDTGTGIPKNEMKNIFKEFRQLPNADKSSEKGLGLGLAIVERIARILEVKVSVRSVARKGSVFSVEVPYGNPNLAAESRKSTQLFRANENFYNKTIFLVEDNKPSLEALKTTLESWGCDIVGATSLKEIKVKMRKLRQLEPDLIIADYHLDDRTSGVEVLKYFKDNYNMSCPALIVTSDQSAKIRRLIENNGYHFMYKPIKPAKLRAFLNHTLTSSPPIGIHYS